MTKVLDFKTSLVDLPNKGRRKQPLQAEVIGTVKKVSGRTFVNTDEFKGADVIEVATFVRARGYDPAQAMVEGLNAMSMAQVRKANPSLQQSLLDKGVVQTEPQARVAAIHIAKTAETFHVSPALVVATMEDILHKQLDGHQHQHERGRRAEAAGAF